MCSSSSKMITLCYCSVCMDNDSSDRMKSLNRFQIIIGRHMHRMLHKSIIHVTIDFNSFRVFYEYFFQ